MPTPLLSLKDVSRTVDSDGERKKLVDGFSFEFEAGRIYTILGPSGAGKSSLLRLINRLDEPTGGEIIISGQRQTDYQPSELRRKIGFLFQTPHLFSGTVADNIRYARADLEEERIYSLASHVHIDRAMLFKSSETLSVGEKQRVAIARLLACEPTIVLLDEPTSALDPSHTAGIERLVKELVESDGLTAIMVTHSPEQALRMQGESILMADGILVEHGEAEQVVNNPRTDIGIQYQKKELR